MGLSAASARIFLLTKENNSYELQAQEISEERMILAKEQEKIANEYSDSTSNNVFMNKVSIVGSDNKVTTEQRPLSLSNLALSMSSAGAGAPVMICDATGKVIAAAKATGTSDQVEYYLPTSASATGNPTFTKATGSETIIANLTQDGYNTPLQSGLLNGAYKLYVMADDQSTGGTNAKTVNGLGGSSLNMVQKDPDSLSGTSSRYYTEDDAQAQAKYQSEMTRVNALDTKLENKLNHVETQKKAVEKELESADSVKSNNVDRTFSYFGN